MVALLGGAVATRGTQGCCTTHLAAAARVAEKCGEKLVSISLALSAPMPGSCWVGQRVLSVVLLGSARGSYSRDSGMTYQTPGWWQPQAWGAGASRGAYQGAVYHQAHRRSCKIGWEVLGVASCLVMSISLALSTPQGCVVRDFVML